MIEDQDVLSINFLKKQNYTGSRKGMRYILRKQGDETVVLQAIVWPQPYAFACSPKESHITADFPFTKEGRIEAINWLNQMYDEHREIWDKAGF